MSLSRVRFLWREGSGSILTVDSLPPRARVLQRNHLLDDKSLLHNRRRLSLARQYSLGIQVASFLLALASVGEILVPLALNFQHWPNSGSQFGR